MSLNNFDLFNCVRSVPLYLSEIASYKLRGSLNVTFQLCITIGILIANVVHYLTPKIKGGYGWRVSPGGAAVPALFIVISSFFLTLQTQCLRRMNPKRPEQFSSEFVVFLIRKLRLSSRILWQQVKPPKL